MVVVQANILPYFHGAVDLQVNYAVDLQVNYAVDLQVNYAVVKMLYSFNILSNCH